MEYFSLKCEVIWQKMKKLNFFKIFFLIKNIIRSYTEKKNIPNQYSESIIRNKCQFSPPQLGILNYYKTCDKLGRKIIYFEHYSPVALKNNKKHVISTKNELFFVPSKHFQDISKTSRHFHFLSRDNCSKFY